MSRVVVVARGCIVGETSKCLKVLSTVGTSLL